MINKFLLKMFKKKHDLILPPKIMWAPSLKYNAELSSLSIAVELDTVHSDQSRRRFRRVVTAAHKNID